MYIKNKINKMIKRILNGDKTINVCDIVKYLNKFGVNSR